MPLVDCWHVELYCHCPQVDWNWLASGDNSCCCCSPCCCCYCSCCSCFTSLALAAWVLTEEQLLTVSDGWRQAPRHPPSSLLFVIVGVGIACFGIRVDRALVLIVIVHPPVVFCWLSMHCLAVDGCKCCWLLAVVMIAVQRGSVNSMWMSTGSQSSK